MNITKRRFRHDKNVSHLIFNYSNRSNKLFPEDVLVNKVSFINDSKIFSYKALELSKTIFYSEITESDWTQLVESSGLIFQKEPIIFFSSEEIDGFL